MACGLTYAWFSLAAAALGTHLQPKADLGSRFACRLLLLLPVGGERPGLLVRIEVLIDLKVALAVVIHQAVSPWLVAAGHRQGGAIGSGFSLVGGG